MTNPHQKPVDTCECGGDLYPVWFTEEEYATEHGTMYKTGRYRRACSHLVCDTCLRNFCIDNSLDGPWQCRRVLG